MDKMNTELLLLNQRGFIPGPKETQEDFFKRIELCEKFSKNPDLFSKEFFFSSQNILTWHEWDWPRSRVTELFDVTPDWIVAFYSKKDLSFYQGAATWIMERKDKNKFAAVQFQPSLKKGKYFWFYDRDEMLSHEAVHVVRMAFNDAKTEEIFAYLTSSSSFRKIFGPIFQSSTETHLLFFFLLAGLGAQLLCTFFPLGVVAWFFQVLSFFLIVKGLFRLFRIRKKFFKTYKKLSQILKCSKKSRAVLFRLTDKEIFSFSKKNISEILQYIQERKENEFRWEVLNLAYFNF